LKKQFWVKLVFPIFIFFSCSTLSQDELKIDLYNLALDFQKAGNLERASFYYEECLALDNPPPQAAFNFILIQIQSGMFDKADRELTLLEKDREGSRELLRLRLYLELGRYEKEAESGKSDENQESEAAISPEVLETAEKLLKVYEKDIYALQVLTQLYLDIQDYESADKYLKQILSSDYDKKYLDMKLQVLMQREDSKEEQQQLLDSFRREEWIQLSDLKQLLSLNKELDKFQESAQLLNRLLEEYPEEKDQWLFQLASLQLKELSLWEEGFRNLRLAFIAGYNNWNEAARLKDALSAPLKEQADKIITLYSWE